MYKEKEKVAKTVMKILKKKKLTTNQVQHSADKFKLDCSDGVAHHLHKLRLEKKIKGEFSKKHGSWVWWK